MIIYFFIFCQIKNTYFFQNKYYFVFPACFPLHLYSIIIGVHSKPKLSLILFSRYLLYEKWKWSGLFTVNTNFGGFVSAWVQKYIFGECDFLFPVGGCL